MKILTNTLDPKSQKHFSLFREWCIEEWGDIDPFDLVQDGKSLPEPILAIKNNSLAGGLAFGWSEIVGKAGFKLWVNAIVVSPDHRFQGVASRLIDVAVKKAAEAGEKELFALTHITRLYEKRGWCITGTFPDGTVVNKSLVIQS